MEQVSRRAFLQVGAVAGAALAAPHALGANERVRVGVIGVANRGGQLIEATLPHQDAEIVALCDVDRTALEKRAAEFTQKLDLYKDYRELLARNDIDAVLIATPDHWHALQTIHACEAGKDVYVEKP
ncbi:MAG: Gfo/Idh/MocA family oxidoreductase, partial [Candidatus Hydrogenedentes bacterium]|nr:Gfo/Idh/MocA family oxidoreductase [Candidatus Hydrogenedentota bacterium]